LDTAKKDDDATALKLLRPLAEPGGARAHEAIGKMYVLGVGVPNDSFQAYIWVGVAIANGSRDSMGPRASIAADVMPGQIERVTETARRCMTSNYLDCGN
jgi:hypothetical protein